ncbi:xylose isomerase domain-containing protein [Paenibacillus mucilaginosus 3016]|uniref:Xylose isomerase domain-containing protein n=3 Tax=Paenibacillus mucilaginosus TaxID=61624 RepID=H6NFC8_9BACL|nr:xylose isomerase domain-containing protein [Paenibacillus mucilaginosus 3016]AFH61714.1 xylose isomerase [Paenibacillus mucilaginosus K02]WFA22571.1 sugar phosphate isomerase/epimerase [Paenibacillus mucilaginosus]
MSWWGMNGQQITGENPSDEEKIRLIAEAGFDGVNGFLPESGDAGTWKELLNGHGLSFSVNAYPASVPELEAFMQRAAAYDGEIGHVNVQVMTPFLTGAPAVELLEGLQAPAGVYGIPVCIETHRGTITQDLLRTVEYVRAIESLRLTVDFSHYVTAGEMRTVSPEAEALLGTLLTRTSAIHGRISNGEQIQIDPGEHGEHEAVEHFVRWWKRGMEHWVQSAGREDVLPFVCELGPPPYAITRDEAAGRTEELGDRWSQSLWLARTARRLWEEARQVTDSALIPDEKLQ